MSRLQFLFQFPHERALRPPQIAAPAQGVSRNQQNRQHGQTRSADEGIWT